MTTNPWAKWLPIVLSVLAMIGSIASAVWAVASERSTMMTRIEAHQAMITDHEARLRGLELTVERMAGDVSWIRQHLAARDGRPNQ